MKIYQLVIHHEQVFVPSLILDFITKDPKVKAWWYYLPNTFLIGTNESAKYFADKMIEKFPGFMFLITKLDMNEYNGYLPQSAWDWIKAHSKVKPVSMKTNPLAPTYGSTLSGMLDHPALKPKTDFSAIRAMAERARKESLKKLP